MPLCYNRRMQNKNQSHSIVQRQSFEEGGKQKHCSISIVDADFAKFQERLSSQSRRMDSVDGTLGVLAVLQFAALTYLVDRAPPTPAWCEILAFTMALPMLLSLLGLLGFVGRESPHLDALQAGLKQDRDRILKIGIEAMTHDYEWNRESLRKKEAIIQLSMSAFAGILAMDIIIQIMLK